MNTYYRGRRIFMTQYKTYELTYTAPEPDGSYVDINLTADFELDGERTAVKGFYDGGGVYRLRFLPLKAGIYRVTVSGIVSCSFEIECLPAEEGDNGVARADGFHFKYDSGRWFYPFGTTVYALAHQPQELVEQTLCSIESSPFNKVRFCVFPKDYAYSKNEPELFAFEKTDGRWDTSKPDFRFWHRFETIIERLGRHGVQCDIILFHPYDRWGFSRMTRAESMVYLDCITRRLCAYPNVWWSLANEYDLMAYSREDWAEFGRFIARNDHAHHLLSNHNCFDYYDFTLPEVTHCSIQDINMNEVPELRAKYGKPVVFDEICYEGDLDAGWGNISAFELTHRFWTAVVCGGYCTHGETFVDPNDILWWAKGGILKGESPERIAFLRGIIESLPSPLDYRHPSGMEWISKERVLELKKNGVPQDMKYDFWANGLSSLPEDRIQPFILKSRGTTGVCRGGAAAIWYYGRTCPAFNYITMPGEGSYNIDIIDIWEMTRTPAAKGVSGTVKVNLPGKEGIAVLAVRCD